MAPRGEESSFEPIAAKLQARESVGLAYGPIVNAMTVDVEEYFHVSAFAHRIAPADWERMESRVERNTDRILALFSEHGARATFFTLGWIAERFPALIRRMVAGGHEVASHSCCHVRVDRMSPKAFLADAIRSKQLLEDVSGQVVRGYRAPSFSIGRETPWAFDMLAEAGYAYSSSIYPIAHDHYGMPEAPRFPFRPQAHHPILEIPVTTVQAFGHRLPCGGGGYFRLLPYAFSAWALRQVNGEDRRPGMFYFHPWEIDPAQPRIRGVGTLKRFRHYVNLDRMEAKVIGLLREFAWDRVDRTFPC